MQFFSPTERFMRLLLIACAAAARTAASASNAHDDDALPTTNYTVDGYAPLRKRDAKYLNPAKNAPAGQVHWRQRALERAMDLCKRGKLNCGSMDLYQFGVFTGRSMRGISLALNKSNTPFRRFWGFDSFQGLPDEDLALAADAKYARAQQDNWRPGLFNAADIYNVHSFHALQKQIRHYINDTRCEFVRGFFNESLTPTLAARRGMRPALYVDIDADLYSSSLQALSWLFAMRLVVPGTVIGYDDWTFGGAQGEQRAHREVMKRYGVETSNVHCRPTNACFEVVKLGGDGGPTTTKDPQ